MASAAPPPLSHSETTRALRGFTYTSGLWGAWVRMVGIGTAVFTGYALWLCATESEIAYFVSIAHLTSVAQLLSSILSRRIVRQKHFVFFIGFVEILLRSSFVLIPFLFLPTSRIPAMAVLLAMGLTFGDRRRRSRRARLLGVRRPVRPGDIPNPGRRSGRGWRPQDDPPHTRGPEELPFSRNPAATAEQRLPGPGRGPALLSSHLAGRPGTRPTSRGHDPKDPPGVFAQSRAAGRGPRTRTTEPGGDSPGPRRL